MKIKEIIRQREVIPKKKCPVCGKTSPNTYRPLSTKYPEGFQI